MKGRINIQGPIQHRMIRLGFGNIGILDRVRSKLIWEVTEEIVQFKGRAEIGHGSKICIVGGHLIIGRNFKITAESQIVYAKFIDFGDDCLLSWQILDMDTDFHKLCNNNSNKLNENRAIHIGNRN